LTDEEVKPDVFYTAEGHKPYTGKCKVYYFNSDQVKDEFSFRRGRLNGASYSWYRNGNLRWKGSYRNGVQSGTWQKWDEEGILILEVNYVNDTLEGSYISRYPDGSVMEKGVYASNRRVGEWIRSQESVIRISNQ
jgi:antitoxin component YwqK of YwqJK toxin-antitoxin module